MAKVSLGLLIAFLIGLTACAATIEQNNLRRGEKPISYALLIDNSGSMHTDHVLPELKAAGISLSNSLHPGSELAIVGFNDKASLIVARASVLNSGPKLEFALSELTGGGRSNLAAGLALARHELSSSLLSRKHILVITDGKIPLETNTYVSEINALRAAGIRVSTIGLSDEEDDFLKLLAKFGKGTYQRCENPEDLPEYVLRHARDFSSR